MVVRAEAKATGSLADAARGRVTASALRSDLGDLHRRPCGPAHSPTQPDPRDLREPAYPVPGGVRHCIAAACQPYCPACSRSRSAAARAR